MRVPWWKGCSNVGEGCWWKMHVGEKYIICITIGLKFFWRTPEHKWHRLKLKGSKSLTHTWSAISYKRYSLLHCLPTIEKVLKARNVLMQVTYTIIPYISQVATDALRATSVDTWDKVETQDVIWNVRFETSCCSVKLSDNFRLIQGFLGRKKVRERRPLQTVQGTLF